ncbi:MAG: response regulator [Candidatus Omnitrophota bacterium]|nr:MAG: response regulator [Candidatus Omnitrophota bacterium]
MREVLIVEDDKEMQEIYKDMFSAEKKGYEIVMANDGVVALRKLKEKKFDLIILDIIMEPIAGDSFFAYVRNDIKVMNIPIIVVSVLSPATLDHLKKINHVHFLQKPISKEGLFKKINEVLEQ